jgi:arylsulfatase
MQENESLMTPETKPNIVFILTDQMRGDCMGVLGHPVVSTPTLDRMAHEGTVFTAAYSACPSCIAARASIFTGQRPTTHGRLGYQDQVPWRYQDTLAEVLSRSGYQTHCIGKTHFYPQRLPLGFETQDSYEANQNFGNGYINDYFEWLKERTDIKERDHGLGSNSWAE